MTRTIARWFDPNVVVEEKFGKGIYRDARKKCVLNPNFVTESQIFIKIRLKFFIDQNLDFVLGMEAIQEHQQSLPDFCLVEHSAQYEKRVCKTFKIACRFMISLKISLKIHIFHQNFDFDLGRQGLR